VGKSPKIAIFGTPGAAGAWNISRRVFAPDARFALHTRLNKMQQDILGLNLESQLQPTKRGGGQPAQKSETADDMVEIYRRARKFFGLDEFPAPQKIK
jgi:hypothetical protein